MSEDPTREDSTRDYGFDELARAVADGSLSRRRALKLFAGTAIAALIPSRALADGRSGRRKNHHHDDECFVRICHVPFDYKKKKCDFDNAETLFVTRSERRRHLKNHRCDFKGKCPRDKTSSSTSSSSTSSSSTSSSSTSSSSTSSSSTSSSSTSSSSTTPAPSGG